jgi:hypothetical protein
MSFRIRPPLQSRRSNAPHPSAGGRGTGYDQTMRELVLAIHNSGNSNDPFVQNLRQQHLIPSLRSEYRYSALNATHGHVRACRRTGNNRATVLRGHDIFFLALYRIVFPKATAAEVNAFLYRANYGNLHFRFYSSSQITEAEKRINLTRKKGSTTAYQALLPINIQKRWAFWNLPYGSGGIADIRRQDIIDLDECGVEVMSSDRSWGKAYVGKRVRQPGAYGRDTKINLLLAISGDDVDRYRWSEHWTGEGTTGVRMINFIRRIINDIGQGTANRRYCFIMDNLT